VADATELVTDPTPPPMIPPFVADAVLEDDAPDKDAAASSNKKVGAKAWNKGVSIFPNNSVLQPTTYLCVDSWGAVLGLGIGTSGRKALGTSGNGDSVIGRQVLCNIQVQPVSRARCKTITLTQVWGPEPMQG
jgi:hypothetical protein